MNFSSHTQLRMDQGRDPKGSLGFILTAGDRIAETELIRMAPTGVGVHFTRLAMPDDISVASLQSSAEGLTSAAALILPDHPPATICYACTSGSIVIGAERVCELIRNGSPRAKATTLIHGVVEALRRVGARRIVVATPYVDEINVAEADFLHSRGFDVLDIQGLGLRHERDMARVETAFLLELARSVDRPDADAVFLSCGALRSTEIIDACETAIGKPVIGSNQAMMWHCLRLAGIADRFPGFGRLCREQ